MKARTFLLALLVICVGGCCGVPERTVAEHRVNHLVLFWLNESGNAAHRRKIIETSRSFRDIPGVLEVRAGQVIPSNREIVDDSFDVAVLLTFARKEDVNAYLVHPLHKKAVEDVLMPLVQRIVVHDFIE